jgi:hypothetical protein
LGADQEGGGGGSMILTERGNLLCDLIEAGVGSFEGPLDRRRTMA